MSLRGKQLPQTESDLANRRPFVHASLSGSTRCYGLGQLPAPFREQFRAGAVVYVVLSYDTPIGWVLDDGTVVIPKVTYSATTTGHQSIVRRAL